MFSEGNGSITFGDEFGITLDFNKDPGSYFESFDVNGDKMADLTSHDGNGNVAIVEGHIGGDDFPERAGAQLSSAYMKHEKT